MPRLADFVVVQDHGSQVSYREDWEARLDFDTFGAIPPAVIMVRVAPTGAQDAVLSVKLNGSELFKEVIEAKGPVRSFHEVISSPLLKEKGNELLMTVEHEGAYFDLYRSVSVSDIVIFYQASTS